MEHWTKDLRSPASHWRQAGTKIIQIKVKILSLQKEFFMNDRREGKSFKQEISLFKFPLARIIHALIYGWNWDARQPRVPSEFRRKNLRLKFPFFINSICLHRSTQGALTMITNVRDWKLKKNYGRILGRTFLQLSFVKNWINFSQDSFKVLFERRGDGKFLQRILGIWVKLSSTESTRFIFNKTKTFYFLHDCFNSAN